MSAKKEYSDFCEGNDDIPLFMRPYWLDAVAGLKGWDAILSHDTDGKIVGAWAIHQRKLRGLNAIVSPSITAYTGIYLDVDLSLSPQKQALQRQEILEDLIFKLPGVPYFEQKLHFSLQDWTPFYWAGYKQKTHYTFRFEKPDPHAIHENFAKSFKRNLRAAEKEFTIETSTDITELYRLVKNVFEIRKDKIPYEFDMLNAAYATVHARGQSTIYRALDENGVNAAILIVRDAGTAYYLLGGRAGSNTRSSTNLLLWRAIQDTAALGLDFDFEGSMMKGVHRFFQSFGATMVPYHYIYRYTGLARLKYLI